MSLAGANIDCKYYESTLNSVFFVAKECNGILIYDKDSNVDTV